MRRGLALTILAVAVLAGFPAAASADAGDPIVYMGIADGSYYPQGYDVSFGFACVSETSGIVACDSSQPLGSKLDTVNAGPHTLWVRATDYEGRQTTATATYTVIDITKPHVIFRTPAEGAAFDQGAFATVDFSCEDDPGGLGILEGACIGTLPVGAPIDTSHLGTFSFSVIAVDRQFNITQAAVHYSVVDRTPPTITFSSPADGATYTLGQQVWASFWCDDQNGSGLNGCKGDVPSGTQLDTSTLGTKTVTVTAYDRAGNVAHESHTYSIVYDFAGDLVVTLRDGTIHRARFSFTK